MSKPHNVKLHDRLGNCLRARLLDNGHILLAEHVRRYTYARLNRRGEVELYDDTGSFSYAGLSGYCDGAENEDEPATARAA